MSLIVFRVDSSHSIGLGHVMRCLTIADELVRRGKNVHFISRHQPGDPTELCRAKDYPIHHIEPSPETEDAWKSDALQSNRVLKELGEIEWLVVDHYELDRRWEQACAEKVNNIFVIDDLCNREHDCDLILDSLPSRTAADYDDLVPVKCRRLVGADYVPLRPQFFEARSEALERRNKLTQPKRLLISVGGMDADNVTEMILDTLRNFHGISVDVVLGLAAPHIKKLQKLAENMPFDVQLHIGVEDMATIMLNSDIAIGGAGSTAWERCCLGLPTLMLMTAPSNQAEFSSALAEHSAVHLLGSAWNLEPDKMISTISTLLNDREIYSEMSESASQLCDGLGAERVVDTMLNTSVLRNNCRESQ